MLGSASQQVEDDDDEDQEHGEERVLNTSDGVPGEHDGEKDRVAPAAEVQIPEEKEEFQAEECSPLHVDMRQLGELVRKERIHDAGQKRRDRVSSDVSRERPGGERREEHPEEKNQVVVEDGRRVRSEKRKAEDGGAVQILRERQDVLRGIEDGRLEEAQRVMDGLDEVPPQNPG